MFSSICEIILGALLRVRVVKNDRRKLYLDLRVLNDRGYNTTSGIFLPSEEVVQFFDALYVTPPVKGVYTEHWIGSKNKLMLLKRDGETGAVTLLISKRPGSYDCSGVCMNSTELENLRMQAQYLINTFKSHVDPIEPPQKRTKPFHEARPNQQEQISNQQTSSTYISMPNNF